MFGRFRKNRNYGDQNFGNQGYDNQYGGRFNRFRNFSGRGGNHTFIGILISVAIIGGGCWYLTQGSNLGKTKQNVTGSNQNGIAKVNEAVTQLGTATHKLGEKTTPASKEGHYDDEYENSFPSWIADNRFQVLNDFNKFKGPYLLYIFYDKDEASPYKSLIQKARKAGVPVHIMWTHDLTQHSNPSFTFINNLTYNNYTVNKGDKMYGKKDGGVYQSLTLINKDGKAVESSQKVSDSKTIVDDAITAYNKAVKDQNNWNPPATTTGTPFPNYVSVWNDMMNQIKNLKK